MDVGCISKEKLKSKYYDTDVEWFLTLANNNRQFSVGHLNVRSAQLHSENMCATLEHTINNVDLLALTETFLSEEKMMTNNYNLPDYQMIVKHREEGRQGGMLCYVNKQYTVEVIDANLEECESLFLKIFFKSECMIAALIVYRRPKLNVPVFI